MRESPALAPKPADTAFEGAASVCEGAILALGCLRPADLRKGKDPHRAVIEAGNYRAVIDRSYPLEQVVDATRYAESEQKTAKVVLTVSGDRGVLSGPSMSPATSQRQSKGVRMRALPNRIS